jgi:FMN phosphatase YigB (HAD superfamily)
VRAVAFDVGETIVDESRAWRIEADRAGIDALTLFAALGALIERGAGHRGLWGLLGLPAPATPVAFEPGDLYPDVRDSLEALAGAGYLVAVAGNQPAAASAVLRACGLPVVLVASSAEWGVSKPSAAFFARLAAELDLPPDRMAYVGDRLDNDVGPAQRAGMLGVFIRRGPWAAIQASRPAPTPPDLEISTLRELPGRLAARWPR